MAPQQSGASIILPRPLGRHSFSRRKCLFIGQRNFSLENLDEPKNLEKKKCNLENPKRQKSHWISRQEAASCISSEAQSGQKVAFLGSHHCQNCENCHNSNLPMEINREKTRKTEESISKTQTKTTKIQSKTTKRLSRKRQKSKRAKTFSRNIQTTSRLATFWLASYTLAPLVFLLLISGGSQWAPNGVWGQYLSGQQQQAQFQAPLYESNLSVSQLGGFRLPEQVRLDYYGNPRLDSERQSLMYPYEAADLTDISSGKPIHDQPLQFRLPFFGFSFEYIWIQRDGYLTFNKGMQTYRFPLVLPIQPGDTFVQEDPALLAPFFAMQDISPETPHAGVYFRLVNLADPLGYYDPSYGLLRDRILLDFRQGMIGASDFVPKWALIVTWRNMTIANRRSERPLKTNTYQAVLATDEIRTYAMFNYEQIEWITHLDNYDGLKGAAAFVGFNAGNTTRSFEFKPYSQHQRVSLLPSGGFGNNLRGRYFFQVDEEVWPGACIDKKLEPNLRDRLPLTFFPRYGHMLGGTLVDVTGPCLEPGSIIFCRFDNFKAEAVWRDTNRASCVSPPFMYHGYVDLTISVDERIEFVGRFYIQPPDIADEDVLVLDNQDRQEAPQELQLKWRPQKLSWRNDTQVSIALWGYRETMNVYPSLTYIGQLASGVRLGQAHFRLDVGAFREREQPELHDLLFGFIAINLTNPSAALGGRNMRHSPVIWSRPMPLAWYFKPQWERSLGWDYKERFCEAWHERESIVDRFAATVWRCPCTLKQVQVDKGRFSPDLQCNIIDRRCDTFHRDALHCVQTGRPSIGGSGQTCCYDDQGELIQTADTIYGGRPARAFPFGKHPFKIRMMIPTLSTWAHDVAPYFYCCLWQPQKDNAPACQNYNEYRTSQDCSLYQPPVIGSVYGDPHLVTFNKNNYTFNGRGEFVLVHTDDPKVKFDVQARFEQVPRRYRTLPSVAATQLSAVAARDNFSSIVEFRIRPLAARWRYHIYVLVDNEYIFWWDKSMQVQNFRGVTLYQPAGIQNMSHIIAMFDSGAGVEVMSIDGYMTAHVYLPADFQGITGGLLGNYSRRGVQLDDLVTPQGYRFGARTPVDRLHRDFGQQWRLTETDRTGVGRTLFSHSAVRYAMYDDANFQPAFQMPPMLPPELMHLQPELDSICSDSISCIYDYVVSYGNKELAIATKKFEAIAYELASVAGQPVVRCPALPKPANGMKSENRYWPGQVVRFSCDVGYRLVGYEARYCRQDGLWSWGEEAQCISEWHYFLTMFLSVMAAFLPMAVTIAAGVLCLVFMVRRSRSHYTGEQGEPAGPQLAAKPELARPLERARRDSGRRSERRPTDDRDELGGGGLEDDDEELPMESVRAYGERAPRATLDDYEDELEPEEVDIDEDEEEDEREEERRMAGARQTLGQSLGGQSLGQTRPERRSLVRQFAPSAARGRDERPPIGARSLFDPRTSTVYSPTTTVSSPTSQARFNASSLLRPFQAAAAQVAQAGALGLPTTASRASGSGSGLGVRQRERQARASTEPDYGPLREARI